MLAAALLTTNALASLASLQGQYDAIRQVLLPAGGAGASPVSSALSVAPAAALVGVDVSADLLLSIDPVTASGTVLGPVTGPILAGLAWDTASGVLFATDTHANALVTVDPTTGATTMVGVPGLRLMHGLALDPATGVLYVAADNLTVGTTFLYRLDKATGAPALVGDIGFSHIGALDFDPASGALYGAYGWADATGYLITIDTATGQGTFVAATHRINGIAFDAAGTLYAEHNSLSSWGPSQLLSVDKLTGGWVLLGDIVAGNVLGIAATDSAGTLSYCTAGTTTNGCVAAIGGAGTPSASAGIGFTISVANVEGQRAGLIFYGIDNTGWSPQPWGLGSTSNLCVRPPVQRMPTQSSGGTIGACDGSLAIDWNAFIASYPGALGSPFAGGETVYAQGWFRDPAAPKTTNLSDGLQFSVAP